VTDHGPSATWSSGCVLRQPQVSKHLRVLSAAGLVDVRVDAQRRIYALRPAPLQELEVWLEKYRRLWEGNFQRPRCPSRRTEDRRIEIPGEKARTC